MKYKNALKPNGNFISVDDGNPGKKSESQENLMILEAMAEKKEIIPVIDKIINDTQNEISNFSTRQTLLEMVPGTIP